MSGAPLDSGLRASRAASTLSLFTSSGTLVCCTLPALLVAIGAGAALSGLVSVFPQIVWLSTHKMLVFVVAGAMLVVAGVFQWRARFAPCPADPALAAVCQRTRRRSAWIYGASVALFFIGAFFAFVAPALLS
ncbi:MAG TPA: hypothetical protein VFS42_04570 [Burkholderiaceae bacterium]|nr:hypothetical protein [Burkholderiaceae bacterium]